MINKEKILKVDIYDVNGKRLLTTRSISFPKDFFRLRGQELVVIKAKDLPVLNKADPIVAIFEYLNGNRVKFETKIDLCTNMQMNFHVGTGEVMEDRRNSFKVNISFEGVCKFYERDSEGGAPVIFEDPLPISFMNINLGGVLFNSEFEFVKGDRVNFAFLDGQIDLMAEVLRTQKNPEGEIIGYGCRFLDVTPGQEELIAKFILDAQIAERDRRRNQGF